MDYELKRRAFLTVAVGTLLGAPVAVHLLRGGRKNREPHRFTKELKRFQGMTQVPIQTMDAPASASLTLAPPIGETWRYAVFAPTFLPEEFSQALGDEPDMFLAREGTLLAHRTNPGQTILTTNDTHFMVCSPRQTDERDKTGCFLLVDNDKLQLAQPKHQTPGTVDRQLVHLLSLPGLPEELAVGKKWKSGAGRVKPFTGYSTDYEIAGFAEVASRRTVQVRFAANIPNLAQMPGMNAQKPDKDMSVTNTHKGNAWFDLATGFLVRQEIEMTTVCRGKEIVTRDKSNAMTIKTDYVVQLARA